MKKIFGQFALSIAVPIVAFMGAMFGLGAILHWLIPSIELEVGTILAGQALLAFGLGILFVTITIVLERLSDLHEKMMDLDVPVDDEDGEAEFSASQIERMGDAIANSLLSRSHWTPAGPHDSHRQTRRKK